MGFHIYFNPIRKVTEESTAVDHNSYKGDYGDALVCNTWGFTARVAQECPFLGKTTYKD